MCPPSLCSLSHASVDPMILTPPSFNLSSSHSLITHGHTLSPTMTLSLTLSCAHSIHAANTHAALNMVYITVIQPLDLYPTHRTLPTHYRSFSFHTPDDLTPTLTRLSHTTHSTHSLTHSTLISLSLWLISLTHSLSPTLPLIHASLPTIGHFHFHTLTPTHHAPLTTGTHSHTIDTYTLNTDCAGGHLPRIANIMIIMV